MKSSKELNMIWWISPIALAIISTSFVLMAFIFPQGLYREMIGEVNYTFLNVKMLLYSLLCLGSFLFGIQLLYKIYPQSLNDTIKEHANYELSISVQLLLTKTITAFLFFIHVMTLIVIVINIPPEYIFKAITGQENSSYLMLLITDILGRYNIINLLTISKILTPWIFFIYMRTKISRNFTFRLMVHLYIWSLFIILILLQNRGPILSLVFSFILIWLLFESQERNLNIKKLLLKAFPIISFAIVYFAIIQVTRTGGFEAVTNPFQLFLKDLTGYFIGSYNRLAAMLIGRLSFPGEGTGYYWTRWFWEFPIISSILNLPDAARDVFGVLPPSGYEERYIYMKSSGLNSRYTAITIFAHSFIDFGWFGFLPFIIYGGVCGLLWNFFREGSMIGIILYPYFSWSILEWRGYIEISRPETGWVLVIPVLIWILSHVLISIFKKTSQNAGSIQ